MTKLNEKNAFDSMIQSYLDGLDSSNKRKVPELEVRFGTGNALKFELIRTWSVFVFAMKYNLSSG
jgi:hypothetical protein